MIFQKKRFFCLKKGKVEKPRRRFEQLVYLYKTNHKKTYHILILFIEDVQKIGISTMELPLGAVITMISHPYYTETGHYHDYFSRYLNPLYYEVVYIAPHKRCFSDAADQDYKRQHYYCVTTEKDPSLCMVCT